MILLKFVYNQKFNTIYILLHNLNVQNWEDNEKAHRRQWSAEELPSGAAPCYATAFLSATFHYRIHRNSAVTIHTEPDVLSPANTQSFHGKATT